MKKMISLLCVVVLLISSCLVVTAEEVADNNYLYKDKFIEKYVKYDTVPVRYSEEYYNYNDEGKIEWCLIYATASHIAKNEAIAARFGDVIISSGDIMYPFDLKYAIYDVEKNKFVDLVDNYDELSVYDELFDVLKTVDHSFLVGDGDRDGVLSIIDANIIQSAIAGKIDLKISEYYDWRTYEDSNYYDVDKDGEFSVMDATAIQMKLAKK